MTPVKEKEQKYVALLSIVQFWEPFCQTLIFAYLMKKLINAKLQIFIIKTAILFDRRNYPVCIYVSKALLAFMNYQNQNDMSVSFSTLFVSIIHSLTENYKIYA